MRDSDHRDAIDGHVLDRGIRHSRGGGFRSVPGECPGDEEPAGTQNRRTRESMANEAAHLWAVAKFVPATAGNPHDADVLAAAQRFGTGGSVAHSADPEGADADEYPIGQCSERYERNDRAGHH